MRNSDFVIIKNTLVRYKGTYPFVEILDGVVTIGKQAFYYQDIQTASMKSIAKMKHNGMIHFFKNVNS